MKHDKILIPHILLTQSKKKRAFQASRYTHKINHRGIEGICVQSSKVGRFVQEKTKLKATTNYSIAQHPVHRCHIMR